MSTPPDPTPPVPPRAVRVLVAALLVPALAVAVAAGAPAAAAPGAAAHAATVPSTVLPGAPDGTQVTLAPAVVRAPDGRAELDVALGGDAPGDVVVALALAAVDVDDAGVVMPGGPAATGTVTRGSRLQPGERLRVVVTSKEPVLLVATVTGAGAPDATPSGDAPVELAALVLSGPPGPPPVVQLARGPGGLVGSVRADAPLLVTVRLTGADGTTWPERLVLPGDPLVVRGDAAPWPLPSVLEVTDEAGRSVSADTGRTPLVVLATALVVVAAVGLALLLRRRRRVRSAPPGASAPRE